MLFLIYNEFTGFVIIKVTNGTKEQKFEYVKKIYGSQFVSIPKRLERFFVRFA